MVDRDCQEVIQRASGIVRVDVLSPDADMVGCVVESKVISLYIDANLVSTAGLSKGGVRADGLSVVAIGVRPDRNRAR